MSRPWVSVRAPCGRPALPKPRRLGLVCQASSEERQSPSLFIFGMGYTGIGCANYFRHRGWNVVGTARSEEKRDALRAKGFQVFSFDPEEYELLSGGALDALMSATHVLSTVPPNVEEAIEDPVLMAHMRHLGDCAQQYRWLGYISSTSVYGNHEGDWVDEQSEVRATSGKGFARLMAEHEWGHLYYNYQMPVHIFRCGGIYGPRRSALEAVQQRGLPSASQRRRARQQYTSRVHVYDICQTLEASIKRPNPGAVYNIVDDDPAGRLEVMQFAAQLLGHAEHEPALVPAGSASLHEAGGAASGRAEPDDPTSSSSDADDAWAQPVLPARTGEKRVRNNRIKRELGVRLAYPTYREGLRAVMEGDMRPFD